MACISKLAGGFAYDCDTGATGLESAIIINKADIASFSLTPETWLLSSLTLNSGTTGYRIDTPKRALVLSERLKINEGAPNAYAHSATLVVTADASPALRKAIAAMSNGDFVIITRDHKNFCRAYGLYYGMSANSIERSSSDNGGWYTIALETPEQFIGEDAIALSTEVFQSLYNAAVY